MSFTGGSISQAALISTADSRLTAVESLAASKVAQTAYDAKVASLEATDASQASLLAGLESNKVSVMAYSAKMALLDATDANQASLLAGLEANKVAVSAYNTKVAELEAADASAIGRLTAVEAKATALESDIASRVQAEIDAKVAQTVFDSLASELRSADSALTAAVATKVATVTQEAVDNAQNAVIATKASIAGVNAALGSLTNAFNAEIVRLDGVDASKVAQSAYDAKIAALEEFIQVMLQTYTITTPNGNYAYTGEVQNLLAPAFSPENPINISHSGFVLEFDLPNTKDQLSFVDVNIGGNWYQAWRGAVAPPNANVLAIAGNRIQMNLPVMVSGAVQIFTRYDVFTGNSNAGYASYNA